MNVPDPTISGHGLGPPPGHIAFQGSQAPSNLVAVPPPPVMPQPGTGKRQRAVGLIPARPGANFPLIVRERQRERIDPRKVSETRAAIRRSEKEQAAAEFLWASTCNAAGVGDADKLKSAKDAGDRTAMLKRTLAEMESVNSAKPIGMRMSTAREPDEVADRLADNPAAYVCLTEGCKHRGVPFEDEADVRRAHPSHAEMVRKGECHVFAILCEAPLDPLDPEGEIVGYVAPVGRDGTTIARMQEEDAPAAGADEVADLKGQIAELRAMLAEALGPKAKK